jgi:RES domain-containing protein
MGVPVVYVSGTLSLALVEVLVHLPSGVLPAYSAIRVEFDEALVTAIPDHELPPDWRNSPAPPGTRMLGDRWFAAGSSAVLRVRSVVVPPEFNYVLNPGHPDFRRIAIGPVVPFPFDARLTQPAKA